MLRIHCSFRINFDLQEDYKDSTEFLEMTPVSPTLYYKVHFLELMGLGYSSAVECVLSTHKP